MFHWRWLWCPLTNSSHFYRHFYSASSMSHFSTWSIQTNQIFKIWYLQHQLFPMPFKKNFNNQALRNRLVYNTFEIVIRWIALMVIRFYLYFYPIPCKQQSFLYSLVSFYPINLKHDQQNHFPIYCKLLCFSDMNYE